MCDNFIIYLLRHYPIQIRLAKGYAPGIKLKGSFFSNRVLPSNSVDYTMSHLSVTLLSFRSLGAYRYRSMHSTLFSTTQPPETSLLCYLLNRPANYSVVPTFEYVGQISFWKSSTILKD